MGNMFLIYIHLQPWKISQLVHLRKYSPLEFGKSSEPNPRSFSGRFYVNLRGCTRPVFKKCRGPKLPKSNPSQWPLVDLLEPATVVLFFFSAAKNHPVLGIMFFLGGKLTSNFSATNIGDCLRAKKYPFLFKWFLFQLCYNLWGCNLQVFYKL